MSVVISGLEHFGVGLVDSGLFGEFGVKVRQSSLERTVEEPAHKAEREDVAALYDALEIHSAVGQSGLGHGCDGHIDYLRLDAEFLERTVRGILGFLEVRFLE